MPSYFGTDGIRGPVATSPLLTPSFLHRFGIALTNWAYRNQKQRPSIVIGRDTRESGTTLERALHAGITYAQGNAVSAGVLPTPALQHLVRAHPEHYQYGLMISASHNPAEDNGIKLITATGKLTSAQEFELSDILNNTPPMPTCTAHHAPTPLPMHHAITYLSRMSTFFPAQLLAGLTIALDCAHGATYRLAPTIFNACGATVHVMADSPNGSNINDRCGSTNPTALQQFVHDTDADLGFAFDGDGDRVIAVTKEGIFRDGDELLALLHTHPRFKEQPTVIGTVMSNFGFEAWLNDRGKKLVRTSVGDTHVLHAMRSHEVGLGGEPSGHIIIDPYLPSADGIFTALFVAHTALLTKNLSMATFTKCPQVTINVPVTKKQDLTQEPYVSIIRSHTPAHADGRSIVRYSGTQSLLRVMVEHSSADQAQQHATQLATNLKTLLA